MKKKVFKLVSLYALFVLPIIMVGFLISGCGGKGYSVLFKADEYVLSIGATKNITEDIELENITLQDLSFYSNDESVFSVKVSSPFDSESKVEITAIGSGDAILCIYLRGETLDTIAITVKNQFDAPKNIQVSPTGIISWDTVSSLVNGKVENATYEIKVRREGGVYETYKTKANSYPLVQKGKYYVSVKAVGTDYIDGSEFSDEVELYYQSLREVANFKFKNEATGLSEVGTLSWRGVENADYYKINIDSEIVEVDKSVTEYNWDHSRYSGGESAVISISACSLNGELMESPVSTIEVIKLGFEEGAVVESGSLCWEEVENAEKYIICYESLISNDNYGIITTETTLHSLDELEVGAYSLSVQAIGSDSKKRNRYYANSKPSVVEENIAKLANPTVGYIIQDDKVVLTVSTEEEKTKEFEIRVLETGSKKEIIEKIILPNEVNEGVFCATKEIELTEVGKYEFKVKNLGENTTDIEIETITCEKALDSEAEKCVTVYKLPSVGTITHSYNASEESIITFARPAYEANYSTLLDYVVKVNGHPVEVLSKDVSHNGYSLNIGKITNLLQNPDKPEEYVITVETGLTVVDENVESIGAISTKTLTRLTIDNPELNGTELTSDYSYSARNASSYKYALYKTDSNLSEKLELVKEVTDGYGRVSKPVAGYYILAIKAYSNNPNLYLNGDAIDAFYVTQDLESPVLSFGETSVKLEDNTTAIDKSLLSGYYVEINAVEDATIYEICLDGMVCGAVADADNDGKIYYYFLTEENFSEGTKTISVIAKGEDDFIIHPSEHEITVKKLATPATPVLDGQKFIFTHEEGELNFYKNAISQENELSPKVEDTNNYTIDTSSLVCDILLIAFSTRQPVANQSYFVQSEPVSFSVHKAVSMTNLYFSGEDVYFNYNESLSSLLLTIGVDNTNLRIMARATLSSPSVEDSVFEQDVESMISLVSGNQYSFKLMDLIESLSMNPDFADLYAQKDSIKLELYIDSSFYDHANSTYVFSSQNAISKNNVEERFITIEKLQSVQITLDEVGQKVWWQDAGVVREYAVIINGTQSAKTAVYNSAKTRYEVDLSTEYSNRTNTAIRVTKASDNYLDSAPSNAVSLYFLNSVEALNIVTDTKGNSYARFDYVDENIDVTKTAITVDGGGETIVPSFDEGRTSYQFPLSDELTNYVVIVEGYIAIVDDTTTHFIRSQSKIFTLTKVTDLSEVPEVNYVDSKMYWQEYTEVNNPKYQVNIVDADKTYTAIQVNAVSLSLENERLLALNAGTYGVEVYALNSDFKINAGESQYYGRALVGEGVVYKLNEVSSLEIDVIENSQISQELASTQTIKWSWTGSYTIGSQIKFVIYRNGTVLEEVNYVNGQSVYSYNAGSICPADGETLIKVIAISDKDIRSSLASKMIYKFGKPTISMTDEKVLSISYSTGTSGVVASNGFIVEVNCEGVLVENIVTTDTSIDLSETLKDVSGNYTINVLIKGIDNIAVCSQMSTIRGVLLEKPAIIQTSEGVEVDSSDLGAEYYVTIYSGTEVVVGETMVSGGKYIFPDAIPSGTYKVHAYAKKTGSATSAVTVKEINWNRVETVSSINLLASRGGVEQIYNLAIFNNQALANVNRYQISIYDKEGNKKAQLFTLAGVSTLTINLCPSDFLEGEGYLGIRALAVEGYANGLENKFKFVVQNRITDLTISEKGLVTWTGEGNYFLKAEVAEEIEVANIAEFDATLISAGRYRYSYYISKLSGQTISVSVMKKGFEDNETASTSSTFMVDSVPANATYSKLEGVEDVYINPNTGFINITTVQTYAEDVVFNFQFVDTLGEKNSYSVTITDKEENVYKANFASILDALGIDKTGEITLSVYIHQLGKLRSDDKEFKFEYSELASSAYIDIKTIDNRNLTSNNLVVKIPESLETQKIYVKTNSTSYHVLSASNKYSTEEYLSGYWVTTASETYFSTTYVDGAISCEKACQISIDAFKYGDYTLSISYLYTTESGSVGFCGWSETLSYKTLPSPKNLAVEGGKLVWEVDPAVPNSKKIIGYVLSLRTYGEDEEYCSEQVYYVKGYEFNIDMAVMSHEKFHVALTAVNDEELIYLKSEEAKLIADAKVLNIQSLPQTIDLQDGVLSASLLRSGQIESYGTKANKVLSLGTVIAESEMPYGYGRFYETKNPNLQFAEGTGTFTAILFDGEKKVQYVRTQDLTRSGTEGAYVYTVNKEAQVYSEYSLALEDVLYNQNLKFHTRVDMISVLEKTVFTYPFVYTIDSLTSRENTFALTFTNKESGKINTVTVNALDLLKNFASETGNSLGETYLEVVEYIIKNGGITVDNAGYSQINALYNAITSSVNFAGLATDAILFDEMGKDSFDGKTGELIESGKYSLSILSNGALLRDYDFENETYSTLYALKTSSLEAINEVEVVPSPSTKTHKVLNEDGYTSAYYLKLAPITLNGVMIEDYVLSLKYEYRGTNYIQMRIALEASEWRLYTSESEYFILNTTSEEGEIYILIPLNSVNGLNEIGLSKNYTYIANIYAVGTDTRFNSKTEPITITFLNFDANVRLGDRGFEWQSYLANGTYYDSMVIYKHEIGEAQSKTYLGSAGTNVYLPEAEGAYDYIMFMTPGSIDRFAVVVDSEVYRIENVYRLYSPDYSVGGEGVFNLINNVNNPAEYTPIYKITNDISVAKNMANPGRVELYAETNQSSYRAGGAEDASAYKLTERDASIFNFVAKGDKVDVFAVERSADEKYFMLLHDDTIFISSKATQATASMLASTSDVSINSEGNITWAPVTKSVNDNFSVASSDVTVAIIYKVVVEYYYETAEDVWTLDGDNTNIYYTKSNELSASLVAGADESNEYIYKITVYAFAGKNSDDLRDVVADINPYTKTNVSYEGTTQYILASEGFSEDFTRLNDVTDIKVDDGKLTWKSEYVDLSKYKFTVYYEGPNSGELKGEAIYDGSKFVFAIDESEQKLQDGVEYIMSVYVSAINLEENALTSFKASSLDKIRIVPEVEASLISISSSKEASTQIDTYDLAKYFEFYDSGLYMKEIVVSYNLHNSIGSFVEAGSLTLTLDNQSFKVVGEDGVFNAEEYKIYLPSGYTMELSFVATSQTPNFLNSYSYNLELFRTAWSELDEIVYDYDLQKFTWTYGKQEGGEVIAPKDTPYFNVYIKYVTFSVEGALDVHNYETRIYSDVTDKSFVPEIANATITEFRIQVREGERNVYSDWLIFNCPKYDTEEAIIFTLFNGGQGTESDPYQIATEEQFKNMNLLSQKPQYLTSYKQYMQKKKYTASGSEHSSGAIVGPTEITASTRYYFTQTASDLALQSEGEYLISADFASVYDGNGNSISFVAKSSGATPLNGCSYATGVDGKATINFNKSLAIFKRVLENGEIKSLCLNVDYTYESQSNEDRTIFAGLVLINGGTISNIEVASYNVKNVGLVTTHLVLAGIVGENNKLVSECKFSAKTTISNDSSEEQVILFGGIVGFNSGNFAQILLSKATSSASVSIRLTNSISGIAQTAGIAITNFAGARISLCGNDGSFSATSSRGNSFSAGVVIYSNGGVISDCYNVGKVSAANYGGIVYNCNSSVANLVGVGYLNGSTSSSTNHIAGVFTGSVAGTCYARETRATNVPVSAITATSTLSTSETGYDMLVKVSSGIYVISFVES